MSIATRVFFCMMTARMRVATLLLVCPSLPLFSSLLRTLWLATVSIALEVDQSSPNMALCLLHQCRALSFCCLDRMSWTGNIQSELKNVEKCEWEVTSLHRCLSVSTISFPISLPVHCRHTHHTCYTGTWQGTWEVFYDIYGIGKYEAWFFLSFFCML